MAIFYCNEFFDAHCCNLRNKFVKVRYVRALFGDFILRACICNTRDTSKKLGSYLLFEDFELLLFRTQCNKSEKIFSNPEFE